MDYIFSPHAKLRMRERGISEEQIIQALRRPTAVLSDPSGRLLFKKLYLKNGSERLLLIATERKSRQLFIITVIDSSKVRKYL